MKARIALVGALAITASVGFGTVARASTLVTVPAPPAAATGVAVQVGKIVSVGSTGATAGSSGSSATAAPITIGGKAVGAGVTNVTHSGSGSAYDSGPTQLGQVTLLPWETNVKPGQASAYSALGTVRINGIGDITLAPST